ncbi:MAG: outer membrane protein assembly factor BamC [Pseudomonadales bacterium]|nr:outer membrane protein assembly factor BamC [Pseudomonadales bacterium]
MRIALSGMVVLALGLSGCSYLYGDKALIKTREDAYREARETAPPRIPAGLDGSVLRDQMAVPEVLGMETYRQLEDYPLPRPASLFAPEEELQVRIQRFDGDEWVVAPSTPSAVWPRIKQFLSDNGVTVVREVPEAGILETETLELTLKGRYRDIVRTVLSDTAPGPFETVQLRVEQAVRAGATEIHLVVLSTAEAPERDGLAWPERSARVDAASALVRELANYLAAEVPGGGISLRAQNIASQAKAEVLILRGLPPRLRLRLSEARAWATLTSAFSNALISVSESDRESGTVRFTFNPDQFAGDEPSWLGRALRALRPGPKDGRAYTLRLEAGTDGFDAVVFDEAGEAPVDRETGEQILTVLREFAS